MATSARNFFILNFFNSSSYYMSIKEVPSYLPKLRHTIKENNSEKVATRSWLYILRKYITI
jgi:hypothetical protein